MNTTDTPKMANLLPFESFEALTFVTVGSVLVELKNTISAVVPPVA